MVINNLFIKLKERSKTGIDEARARLLSMEGKIPVLRDIKVEIEVRGPERSSYDLMLITRFDTLADLETYVNHPVHLEVADYIKQVMDTGASLCYAAG